MMRDVERGHSRHLWEWLENKVEREFGIGMEPYRHSLPSAWHY